MKESSMNTSPKMPPGYDGHLKRTKALGIPPMSPERWVEVLAEWEAMPGTMDPYPEEEPPKDLPG
jgi:hypothetical protein